MRTVKNLKDLNEIFPFDFYFYLNQAIKNMGLVVANPSFVFTYDDELKNIEAVSDLKHQITLFETMQRPNEDFVTEEMFETEYIKTMENDIPFYVLTPAIKIESADKLYKVNVKTVQKDKESDKLSVDALELTDELPVDDLTQVVAQLFDEDENYLIAPDKPIPDICKSPFDERLVIQFIGKDGTGFYYNKPMKWLDDYYQTTQKDIEKENSFEKD